MSARYIDSLPSGFDLADYNRCGTFCEANVSALYKATKTASVV